MSTDSEQQYDKPKENSSDTACNDDRPIMVTGAGGYLGGRLMQALERLEIPAVGLGRKIGNNVSITADLSDWDATHEAILQTDPKCVIHTAAEVPKTLGAYGDTGAARRSLAMAENVANAIANLTDVWMIYISSMTVYQHNPKGKPINEFSLTESQSAYGEGKLAAESAVSETGINCLAARIPGLYGKPRQGGLIDNLLASLRKNEHPNLPAAPLLWAAMHVEDAAEAIIAVLNSNPSGFKAVNMGYSGPISITRVVEAVSSHYNRPINYDIEHPDFEYDLTLWSELSNMAPKPFADVFRRYIS